MTMRAGDPEPRLVDVAGTEPLAEALRRAVARGQAAVDARQMERLATLSRSGRDPPQGGPVAAVTTVRRYRVAEVSIAFEAVVRRDPRVEGGLAFLAAVPARRAAGTPWWPRRVLDTLLRRRLAPVTITIRPDAGIAAGRTADRTGMDR